MKTAIFVITFLFFNACSSNDHQKPQEKIEKEEKEENSSKIDQILGEKVIDIQLEIIREDNFSDLLRLSRSDLLEKSKLYKVKELVNDVFCLSQVKLYNEARTFEVLLKLDNDSIRNYLPVYDEQIIDFQYKNDTIFVLTQNNEYHHFWRKANGVNVYAVE